MLEENKMPMKNAREEITQELASLAPALASSKAPGDVNDPGPLYFERMQDEVMAEIRRQQAADRYRSTFRWNWRPIWRVAAVVALGALALWIWRDSDQRDAGNQLAGISDEALFAFVSEDPDVFAEIHLLEMWELDERDLFSFADLYEEELEQYLRDYPELLDQLADTDFY
jgi:hypothetical protein